MRSGDVSLPIVGGVHAMVARHAAARPDDLAVVGVETLTYRQLDDVVAHAAAGLRARGVGPGDRVGVVGQTTAGSLIAMLAANRAGAAYVPVRHRDPLARVQAVAEDAGIAVFVATGDEAPAGLPVVALDDVRATSAAPVPVLDATAVADTENDEAYVLYTSGSTGRPKGVAIGHGPLANYLRWVARANRLGMSVPVIPAVTDFSFDASVQQLLAPLARGDAVWFVAPGTAADPEQLVDVLAHHEGPGLHCVPSLWAEVLDAALALPPARRPWLVALYLGGEVVSEELWQRTRAAFPDAALANVYGPTEATVQVTGGYQPLHASLSCGWPVDNARIDIVGPDGQILPPGEVGQIRISGPVLGRYVNDPGRTDSPRFADDPAVGRCFLTGDRGLRLPNAAVRVLGRDDDLLKVRGFRVDPRDVEAAIAAHDPVRAAAVTAVGEGAAARLRAVVVGRDGDVDAEALRAHLREVLPDYLVPSEIVPADALPRLANGKLDRAALRLLTRPAKEGAGQAPADDVAAAVTQVWRDMFDGLDVGPDDDFFLLGGYSLLATRLVGRTRAATKRAIPIRAIFDHPTLGRFIDFVRAAPLKAAGEDSAAAPTAAARVAPVSMQQQVLLGADGADPSSAVFAAFELPPNVDDDVVRRALDALAARHPVLACVFEPGDSGPVARVVPDHSVEVRRVDVPSDESLDAAAYALVASLRAEPFALASVPPLRAAVIRSGRRAALLVELHHLLSDGLSLRVLAADVAALLAGRELGPPPPSYLDYAVEQRASVASLAETCRYWAGVLGTTPYRPLADAAAAGAGSSVHVVRAAIAPELARAVELRCATEATTPFIVYSAAIAAALGEYHEADEVRLGALVANRDDDRFEHTVGPFANTVVLRLPTDRELAHAGDVVLGALAHQGAPLEVVLALTLDEEAVDAAEPVRPFDATFEYEPGLDGVVAGAGGLLRGDAAALAHPDDVGGRAAPLSFAVRPGEGGLELVVITNPSIYSPEAATALASSVLDAAARLVGAGGALSQVVAVGQQEGHRT